MKTVAVLSRKGGAGKTTVSVSLALSAQQAGLKVVLADIDPLHSAAEVLRMRPEAAALLVETTAAKLFILKEACKRNGCDLLIIDTPTAPEAEIILAITVADLALAVARPTTLDVAAVAQSSALITRLGCPGLIVLNQCPSRRAEDEPLLVQQAAEALRFSGLPLAAAKLRSRMAYQHAFAHNRAVTEWAPEGDAAADVLRLLAEITERLLLDIAPEDRARAATPMRHAAPSVPAQLIDLADRRLA